MFRIVCAALLLVVLNSAQAGEGLCKDDEKVFFNCHVKNKKFVSLCGNPPAVLQYRFGKPKAIELSYPPKPEKGAKEMLYAHYNRPQTDYTTVSFNNGEINYILAKYRNGSSPAEAQIEITDHTGAEVDMKCEGAFISKLEDLKPYLPCDTESALSGPDCAKK